MFKFTDDCTIRVHMKYYIRFTVYVMRENCFHKLNKASYYLFEVFCDVVESRKCGIINLLNEIKLR